MSISDHEAVSLISELAKEGERVDNIDWGDLSINEDDAFKLMSSEVYEKFKSIENMEGERLVLLSCVVKLTVENFVLNLQLMKAANGNKFIK